MPHPAPAVQGTCHVKSLASLTASLREWGYDAAEILAEGDVRLEQLDDPEHRISIDAYRSVWEAARRETGDEAIGLHVVENFDPRNAITPFVYLASSSATPREAFKRVAPFIQVAHNAVVMDLEVVDDRTIFRAEFRGFEDDLYVIEYFIGMVVKIAPMIVGGQQIEEIWFKHSPPAYAAEYPRILGLDVLFDAPDNAITGRAEGLDRPLPNADEVLCNMLERQAIAALERMPKVSDFAHVVRQRIESQIGCSDVSAEAVAAALGLSDRTLRRRLSECGVRYQELLDSVRCELARQALARPGATVGEVAFSLGFSDTSAFHKAFRRWTGIRPSDYKQAAR